jgi:hypothetical protein
MSHIIVRIETNTAVAEIFDHKLLARLNTEKYRAVPVQEWLAGLNGKD